MKNNFLLAVDGSKACDRAIEFAAERAKRAGAKIIVAYVIEWSPYSFNTPEENAERHKRREEELDKATNSVLEPVAAQLKAAGLEVATEVRHGNIAQTLIELAGKHDVSQIVVGHHGETNLKSLIFGSVAAKLVQSSPVPVTTVP